MASYIFSLQRDNLGSFDLSDELCFRRLSIFLASWSLIELKTK